MSKVPQDHNGQPGQSATEVPTAGAALANEEAAATSTDGVPQIPPHADPPHRRHRRRRRHREPRLDAASTAPMESPAAPQKTSAQQAGANVPFQTTTEHAAPAPAVPTGTEPRKRRRRGRRRPRPEGAGPGTAKSDPTSGAIGDVVQAAATKPEEPRRDPDPRHRDRGQRTSREEQSRDRENGRNQSRDRREGDGRHAGARDGRGPRDKRGTRDRKERRHERDRGTFPKKPAPKLYHLESIVDRGFEDMPDSTNEGATRRVDWTILKRTTAEQRTARAVSAVYILRRDGVDTEFAHLSEARAAVHKTINHPEKLTLSRADHVAARGTKK